MASNTKIKGFTLIESMAVLFLFTVAIVLSSQTYNNLVNSSVLSQNLQLAFDNFRFGAEKIWNEIKNGSNFIVSQNSIEFLDRNCNKVQFYLNQNNNIIFNINNNETPLFDSELVKFNSFEIFYDQPSGNSLIDPYFKYSNKIFLIKYSVILQAKTLNIPLEIYQVVAPSNSAFINNPCQ